MLPSLFDIIKDWLSSRKLTKWKAANTNTMFVRRLKDDDEDWTWLYVYNTHVVITYIGLFRSHDVEIFAADPEFFTKLEKAIRHEEIWCNFMDMLCKLYDVLARVWRLGN